MSGKKKTPGQGGSSGAGNGTTGDVTYESNYSDYAKISQDTAYDLNDLHDALESGDGSQAYDILSALDDYDILDEDTFQQLQQDIEEMRYDEAATLVEDIMDDQDDQESDDATPPLSPLQKALATITDIKKRIATVPESDLAQADMIRADALKRVFGHGADYSLADAELIIDALKTQLAINKATARAYLKQQRLKKTEDTRTHAEIAADFLSAIAPPGTTIVYTENNFYLYRSESGLWHPKAEDEMICEIGASYNGKHCKTDTHYKAIARHAARMCRADDFFSTAPPGIPCATEFWGAQDDGTIEPQPYTPDLKQRYKFPYDPDFRTPERWLDFLGQTFKNAEAEAQIALLQEVMGLILLGLLYQLHKVIVFLGSGANGKSVILDVAQGIVIPEVCTAISPDQWTVPAFLADLAGKRINICGELTAERPLESKIFKEVVAADPVTARPLYQPPFTFRPQAAHIFACNELPKMRDFSHGFFRRWLIFECPNTVPDHLRNAALAEELLQAEAPQVMAWCIRGAQRYMAAGRRLTQTATHDRMLHKWRNLRDTVYAFINDSEVVAQDPDSSVSKQDMYRAYVEWCRDAGQHQVGRNQFYKRMKLLGFKAERKSAYDKESYHGFYLL